VEAKECNHIIQKAIDQLPSQRRIIYRLSREEGMNYQEIAGELHLSSIPLRTSYLQRSGQSAVLLPAT
jgi:RNA polymerase sigma-70 factor (ECF subfamily)